MLHIDILIFVLSLEYFLYRLGDYLRRLDFLLYAVGKFRNRKLREQP